MVTVVFLVAAVLAVVSAVVAVSHRDPVFNVLSLVVTFFCVAVNYALLGADFLAAAQILVYAGAILVLFLFVIMLLDGAPDRQRGGQAPGPDGCRPGAGRRSSPWAGRPAALTMRIAPARTAPVADTPGRSADSCSRTYACLRADLRAAPGRHGGRPGPGEEEALMAIPTTHFLVLAALLFAVGAAGVLLRRSGIAILLGIELMLNAGNLALVAFSRQHGSLDGQVFVFFVMAVAAAEAAVGLAILVAIFRKQQSIDVDRLNILRW